MKKNKKKRQFKIKSLDRLLYYVSLIVILLMLPTIQLFAIDKILDIVFEDTGIEYETKDRDIILMSKERNKVNEIKQAEAIVQQQQKTVAGKVSDTNGESLPGVTILIKGTSKGTISDIDGNYTLTDVSENAILQFSFVGMETQEVVVGNQVNINIILEEESIGLDEVVAVGYGSARKIDLTSAVSAIKGEEILETPSTNITNSLVGRLPGLIAVQSTGRPGYGSDLSIRGRGTFGDASVLTVVDGVVKDFQHIDPNEIESVTILKDASAAAVYGARAANGVILVTTKRGAKGKPTFNYNAFAGIQSPTIFPTMSDGYQYAKARNEARENMGRIPYYTEEEMAAIKAGQVHETNWYDETLNKNAFQTQQNISVNGGTDDVKYFMSLGWADQDGLYSSLNYERFSVRSNVDAKINDYLDISLDINGIKRNDSGSGFSPESIFTDIMAGYPFDYVYNPDGTYAYTNEQHPVAQIQSGYERNKGNQFQTALSFKLDLPFLKGLSWSGKGAYAHDYSNNKAYRVPVYMHRYDDDGNFMEIYPYGGDNGRIAVNEYFSEYRGITLTTNLNYDATFGDHTVGGLLLFEQFEGKFKDFSAYRTNYPAEGLDELSFGGELNKNSYGGSFDDARRSYVGRANYSYKDKYLLQASFRSDGSAAFSDENKYGFFPAVSAGWRISEEPFWQNSSKLDFFDYLKFRVSYGVLGNDRTVYSGIRPTFQYRQYYNMYGSIISGSNVFSTLTPGVLPNPNVTWEKSEMYDVGIDGALWGNLLSFEIDGFYKRTSDILMSRIRSIPRTLGASLPAENYAVVDNKGVEFSLEHRNKVSSLDYFVRFNVSYAENKVITIDEAEGTFDYQIQTGRPLGYLAGYRALGLFQSDEEVAEHVPQFNGGQAAGDVKYADLNGDGVVNYLDQEVISKHNPTPKLIAGLSFGGSYKNFDLSVLFQGAGMRSIMLEQRSQVLFFNGSWNNFTNLLDYWTPENRNAKYPRAWEGQSNLNNFYSSSWWLRDGKYLRLKSIDFGYTLPNKVVENIGFERVRLYFSGTNLFYWDKLNLFDPEVTWTGAGYYPQQRTLNFGVNVSF